jgi:type I restriction enzyme, S subunit
MTTYDHYKQVKTGWIAQVPSHWEAVPVKYVCTYNDEVLSETADPEALIEYVEISDVDEARGLKSTEVMPYKAAPSRARRIVRDGDVIISTVRTYLRAVAPIKSPPENLIVSTGFAVIRPERLTSGFARYALVAEGFVGSVISRSTGVSYPAINASDLVRIPVPVPPIDEQVAIAAYLDAETKRIDVLIDEKRSLLISLAELRVTRITEILTGTGLEQKDTGSEWFPKIPKSWELKRLKFLGQVRSGVAKGKKYDGQTTVEMPYLRVANVQDGYLKLDEISLIEVSTDEVERYTLQFGDVLMNEGGDYDKLGRGAVWESQIEGCLHQNHVFAVRLDDVDLANWVSAITQTAYAKFYFMNNSKQSTNLASINQGNVKEFPVVLPPPGERLVRQKMLQESLAQIDDLVAHAKREIEVLGEFRSSTITDAVLGRIDVRTAQAH